MPARHQPPHRPPRARLALALTLALTCCGAALRIAYLSVPVYTPDEDAYANFYATNLFLNGLGSWPDVVRDYQSRPEMLAFPSPTRIGHLAAIVGWMHLTGSATIQTAAQVSLLASIAGLALVAAFAWRFVAPWATPITVLFAAFAPLDRALSRRVWGDALTALLVFAMIFALVQWYRRPRARWMAAFFALGAATVLVKESGLFFLALGTLALAVRAARARPGHFDLGAALRVLGGALVALGVAAALMMLASGGWAPLRATFVRAAQAESTNAYMREFQSGGPEYYVTGLGLTQPLPMLLGFAAAIAALAIPTLRRRLAPERRAALVALAVTVLAYAALALVYPQKNLRFLSPIYAPLDLLAAWLTWTGLAAVRARAPRAAFIATLIAAVALLAGSAVLEQRRFVHYFVTHGVPDLATPWFTRADR